VKAIDEQIIQALSKKTKGAKRAHIDEL